MLIAELDVHISPRLIIAAILFVLNFKRPDLRLRQVQVPVFLCEMVPNLVALADQLLPIGTQFEIIDPLFQTPDFSFTPVKITGMVNTF